MVDTSTKTEVNCPFMGLWCFQNAKKEKLSQENLLEGNAEHRLTPQGIPYSAAEYFLNQDHHYLFAKTWKPRKDEKSSPPKGIVFISHGMSEHCLTYEKTVAKPLTDAGFIVISHDHIGHGQSEGERVMVTSFQHYVRDVIDHIEQTLPKFPKNLPVFLLGHSMGAVIGLLAVLERPQLFRGIILNGAAVQASGSTVSPVHLLLIRIFSTLCPSVPVINLALEKCSSDPGMVKMMQSDPYRHHGGVKAKMATQYLQAVYTVMQRLGEIHTSLLIMHGMQDKLALACGSQNIYDKVLSTDKEILFFENAFHQLHLEPNGQKERFLSVMLDWMTKRV